MKVELLAGMIALGAGVASAEVISAANGLDLTSSTALAQAAFTAENGAVIRVKAPANPQPGFMLHQTGATQDASALQNPQDPVWGEDKDTRLDLFYAENLVGEQPAGIWTYQGRWKAPKTGAYSFFVSIDDLGALLIDGCPVVVQSGNTFGTAQDVWLAEGWHDIEVKFVNTADAMGPWTGLTKGVAYSPDNLAFTKENAKDGVLFKDAGDGSTVQAVYNGAFRRKLHVPSGTATLDLTQSGLAGVFCFGGTTFGGNSGGLRTGEGAGLLVRGADRVRFRGVDRGDVHFSLLDADVAFEGNAAGKVLVAGRTSIARMRDNYEIEAGSDVAYWGADMIAGDEWRLENRNAHLLNTSAVAPGTRIVVADGANLTLKPCQPLGDGDDWMWHGTKGTFANDFNLDGENAALTLRGYYALELTGAITGTGDVVVNDGVTEGPVTLSGDLTGFSGTYTVVGNTSLALNGRLPEGGVRAIRNGINAGSNGGGVEFLGATPAEVRIGRLWGCQATGYVKAAAKQEIRIDRFAGVNGLKTENLTDSRIVIGAVEAGGVMVLRWTANVRLDGSAADAQIRVVGSSPSRIELGAGCDYIGEVVLDEGSPTVYLCGAGAVARVTGAGTVVVEEGVRVDSLGPNVVIRPAEGGSLTLTDTDKAALDSALGARPALWLDASRADTMQQYLNCVFTNGIVMRRWNDCRPEQTTLYGLNPRGGGYMRVYPYVMTNALNGMSIVSMGAQDGMIEAEYAEVGASGDPKAETRRLPFNKPINVRTAIIVFGSQFGGGGAILGGDMETGGAQDVNGDEEWIEENVHCSFTRGGTANDYKNSSTAIFAKKRNTWVDGLAVDPTKTGYNGGWQIVSFESETEAGEVVRSLGKMESWQEKQGGQNYAEILLYTNALTTAERRAVEVHLARKWGLACGSLPLNGAGHVDVADVLPAEGAFSGTVNLAAGARLDLGAAPQTEADVPAEGRVGWFDPDDVASVELAGASQPGMEDRVYGVFDRVKGRAPETPYLYGLYNGSADRRPRAVRGAHGDGPARTWLQFYGGENTMRIKNDPSQVRGSDSSCIKLNIRTAFIVSDSVHGGGMPISDDMSMNGLVRCRNVSNAASPIWASGTDKLITGGLTRLNGQKVDGTTTGFTGGPEVFSFTTTADFPAGFFGWWQTSREVLGEILLYNRELAGEERDAVERYLAWKWLGRLPGGWCDWRRATVSGAGTVTAADQAWLPGFDAAFAGTLDLAGPLAFHVDAAGAVTDALNLPTGATLTLPAEGTLDVTFSKRPVTCVLARAGAVTGMDPARWTVNVTPEPRGTFHVVCANGELRLEVPPSGTVLYLR